jgi:hypothetical protein
MNSTELNECGFPLTIGSIDIVHIRMWNVASNLKNTAEKRNIQAEHMK